MARSRRGDREAYADLLTDLGAAIERYLRSRFGRGDFLEDCVQECLLSVHRALSTYDPKRRFSPWLYTIVRHKAIDFLRRGGTRAKHEAMDAEPYLETTGVAPEAERSLQAAQLLSKLDDASREALVLTKLQGYSLAEAASRAGVTLPAMKSRVHRALRQARSLLEADEI